VISSSPLPFLARFFRKAWPWLLGLAVLGLYLGSVLPPDPKRLGYIEDACYYDLSRGLLAEQMREGTFPRFETDRFMAPQGSPIPFFSWSIERDWLGAWFWRLSRDFPFHWTLYAFSLALSFTGVGLLATRFGLTPPLAALFTTLAVGLHVPRHFKTFHHFEHLIAHWIFLSFFLDAWIWKRWIRDARWSWSLEAWRVVLGLAALLGTGYTWPILLLEGSLVRAAMLATLVVWPGFRGRLQVEGSRRSALVAGGIGVGLLVILGRWFGALAPQAARFPTLWQPMAWFGEFSAIFDSLTWLKLSGQDPARFETVVTPGWTFVLPALLGIVLLFRRQGGRLALLTLAPFLGLAALLIPYSFAWGGLSYHQTLQSLVPLLRFVRVGSRVGLFFPQLFAVLILLCWPELREAGARLYRRHSGFALGLAALFALHTLGEASWLLTPIRAMEPLDSGTVTLLEQIRDRPGDLVLDLPFCAAGGNGICTQELCPHYPRSTAAHCFRAWHDKGVYGLYAGRMVPEFCAPYFKQPFVSWVRSWHEERCLAPWEWDQFCTYLKQSGRHAAVLVYPHLWKAAAEPGCQAEFENRLGPPLGRSTFSLGQEGGQSKGQGMLIAYPGQCR
jgi:hypothetical protein